MRAVSIPTADLVICADDNLLSRRIGCSASVTQHHFDFSGCGRAGDAGRVMRVLVQHRLVAVHVAVRFLRRPFMFMLMMHIVHMAVLVLEFIDLLLGDLGQPLA